MDNYDDAIARLDDELHGQNYELYTYLHDVISVAQAENTRLRERIDTAFSIAGNDGSVEQILEVLESG